MKKIIVFDLDGTLAESKQSLDEEMSSLLYTLLSIKKVAIVSGGGFPQLEKQVINKIPFDPKRMQNLYILPTKGAVMYKFDGKKWIMIYENTLLLEEKKTITEALEKVQNEVDFLPKEHYGPLWEDRGSQFTFSALGQDAPVEIKKDWDKNATKRKILKEHLDKYLSEFAVEIGGSTSIDITQKSIDKAFAIERICQYLDLKIEEVLFVGDAIFPGGNDYSVTKTGVDTAKVANYNETKSIIRKIINEKQKLCQ